MKKIISLTIWLVFLAWSTGFSQVTEVRWRDSSSTYVPIKAEKIKVIGVTTGALTVTGSLSASGQTISGATGSFTTITATGIVSAVGMSSTAPMTGTSANFSGTVVMGTSNPTTINSTTINATGAVNFSGTAAKTIGHIQIITSSSITLSADAVTVSTGMPYGSLIISTATPANITKPNIWQVTGASTVIRFVGQIAD